MANIYDSIVRLVKPARIATAVHELGETEHKVVTGIDIITPSLLAKMLKKGDTLEVEEAIKAFLASDKFKNATDAELRTVWFEFSDIEFEHNSATDLMPGAQASLKTLAGVLKGYSGVKMKIDAFADKTGTRAVNYAISEKRARNIETTRENAGIHADNVSVEGFGEQYAQIPKSATNAERTPDRDIAMRFTK